MNVLFVCKWNRFRSKVAEAYFNQLNEGTEHEAKSVGVIFNKRITEEIISVVDRGGLKIDSSTHGLDFNTIDWADLIILVGNDVDESIFSSIDKELINWNIADKDESHEDEQLALIEKIKSKVDEFTFKNLEKE